METVKRLLADIDAFAPTIHARADQIEASSRVPIDLIEALKSIGVFRMFAPGSHDGLELGLPSIVDVISHIGRINGSVGWVSMIGCSSGLFLPSLPGETYEHIYRNGPDLIMAGSAKPAGTAEAWTAASASVGGGRSPAAASMPISLSASASSPEMAFRSPAPPARTSRRCALSSCLQATSGSRTPGTSPDFAAPAATTSP